MIKVTVETASSSHFHYEKGRKQTERTNGHFTYKSNPLMRKQAGVASYSHQGDAVVPEGALIDVNGGGIGAGGALNAKRHIHAATEGCGCHARRQT